MLQGVQGAWGLQGLQVDWGLLVPADMLVYSADTSTTYRQVRYFGTMVLIAVLNMVFLDFDHDLDS